MRPVIRLLFAPLGAVLRSREHSDLPNPFLANFVDRVSNASQRGFDHRVIGPAVLLRQLHLLQIQGRHKTRGLAASSPLTEMPRTESKFKSSTIPGPRCRN